ncbi:MAG: 16S rRNA (cytosine(967)-C(5))-methyltransferase RsmB [Candidatus Electrothrix aestuarii]|uniref:16S rRNA (cytosine(967)-C(5))-methyltransferase n=1 Tax=Candidatus Electrothrix aestuarii TaxID=3062594 RepID=A0AAU8LZ25_9BACT|nr:16S rRNA (cytosine(967)-C(5))-methyltransferase RsmB [Candidatus Electrothrix aestuarii]
MKEKKGMTSRGLALETLVQWTGSGKPVQGFINRIIHDSGLKNEERQLAVMLVLAVLREQEYLDLLISRFSKTKLGKMKPLTLAALRIGVVQICRLERIPDSAAVNETVKALKKMRQPGWLCSFVNGTLRTIARNKESLPKPENAGPGGTPLLNHPAWLTDRWQEQFGLEQMREICRVNNLEPELCLQVNQRRTDRDALKAQFEEQGMRGVKAASFCPDSLILPEQRGAVTDLPGFAEGLFQVQDQAARLACELLRPFKEQGRYLDGCAGLGGKTCILAALLPQDASLVAVEPDQRRSRLLQENLQRQGFITQQGEQVQTLQQDLQTFAAAGDTPDTLFDGIFIDAPCSGTGVIRKHPDIRWNRQPEDLISSQQTQLELLHTAAVLLKPGGVLVYATCSLEPEENQQVVEQFLATNDAFMLTDCRDFLPASAASLVDAQGFFAPLPTEEIEGFFAARLVFR